MAWPAPEIPGAVVVPAHPTNYGYGVRKPDFFNGGIVIHTPEERADAVFTTAGWFQNPRANASTHLGVTLPGALVQMVPLGEGAWGQGTNVGNRWWRGVAGARWPVVGLLNNNLRSIGIEVEGYAATIHQTMSAAQWDKVVWVTRWLCNEYSIPMDRDHIIGHDEINRGKRDPGVNWPWDKFMRALKGDVQKDAALGYIAVAQEALDEATQALED